MYKSGDREFVLDLLLACKRILEYTKGMDYEIFSKNQLVIDAVARNIEILGEASKNVSKKFREKYQNIEWKEIAKTRDKIIHSYFGISLTILWDIVTIDIPLLKDKLEKIIELENWEKI